MSVLSDLFFANNHARVGRFVQHWCCAVWKKDPTYHDWRDDQDETGLAIRLGWIVRHGDGLRLTGPLRDKRWLLGLSRSWTTYAITAADQDIVKVGKSTNVERRFEELQVASPHQLVLLGTRCGDHEQRVHRELRSLSLHVSGEWFRLTDQSRAVLSKAGLLGVSR